MNDYFLILYLRERKREILEEINRGRYQTAKRRSSSGGSKTVGRRLVSALLRCLCVECGAGTEKPN